MKRNEKKDGIILSYLSQGIMLLTGLIYTPIMLRLMGKSEYGLYQLVYSVVSYLGLLNFGFNSSYIRFYTKAKLTEDEEEVSRLNGMFMLIFLVLSVLCILCGSVLLININMVFGDGLTAYECGRAKVLLSLMIFNMALTFPDSVYTCYATARERFIFPRVLIIIKNILNPFLTLPLLLLGIGSIGVTVVASVLTAAHLICNVFFCHKILKMKFSFQNIQWSRLKEMWVFTAFIFINQIVDQINWNIDKVILGRMSGTEAVAVYGVGSQINSMYINFSSAASSVFIPQVNQLAAKGQEHGKMTRLFTKVGRLQFAILALILSGFLLFGKSFITLWAGSGYEEVYQITLLLIIPVTVPLIQNLGIEIQRAHNKHRNRSAVYLGIAIVNIGISIPLVSRYGPVGAAAGTAIALLAGNILYMNWYYHNRLAVDMIYFWKKIGEFLPAIVVSITFGYLLKRFMETEHWIQLAIAIVLYTLVYLLSMYFLGINEEEKCEIKKMWKGKKRALHDR